MEESDVRIQKVKTQEDLDEFIAFLNIKSPKVIIKPNWVTYEKGTHTEAKILDMFLTAIKKPAVLIESYSFWRTDKVLRGEGNYFPDAEGDLETGKAHWNFFKEQDETFLKETGIGEVLKKHGAEYVNITNEVWEGRMVEGDEVKTIVESRFKPVGIKDLYSYIPKKLWDLKGSDLISLSKAKIDSSYGASLSIKNLFGLIPDPTRYEKYHGGEAENLLVQNIVDINKIYQSLFNTRFVVEGVFEHCKMDWTTEKATPILDWKTVIGGFDGLKVDTKACELLETHFFGSLDGLLDKYNNGTNLL